MGKYNLDDGKFKQIYSRLNPDQKSVVDHKEGPAIAISGAGSGKTSVTIARIYNLMHNRNVRPESIVAITLTKKAAEEMSERMLHALGEDHEDIVKRLTFKTIHSFCLNILTKTNLNMDPMYDKPDMVVGKKSMLWKDFMRAATKGEILYANTNLEDYLSQVGFLKRTGKDIMTYAKEHNLIENGKIKYNVWDRKGKTVLDNPSSIVAFYVFYEKWKLDNNCIDFDDILLNCLEVLTNPSYTVYSHPIVARITELMIDEAQDTTGVAFKIIRELMKIVPNVVIVGDLRQNIYSFAGADPQNVLDFIRDYNPPIFDLSINYRSTDNIVRNANRVVERAVGLIGKPSIAFKTEDKERIRLFISPTEREEADEIAEDISQKINMQGIDPAEIAITYRVHSQAVALEDALHFRKIPYFSYSKQAFYQRREVVDIFCFLRLLSNPLKYDKTDFKRIVNKPNNFVSQELVDAVYNVKKVEKCSVIDAIDMVSGYDHWRLKGLFEFRDKVLRGIKFAANANHVGEVVDHILKDMGYLKYMADLLEVSESDTDIESNFDAIRGAASRFASVEDFMEHIDSLREESNKEDDGKSVRLMSIHAIKGKEFDHIYVAGICDRMYPFYRCEDEPKQVEEERRIMYVAVTRPRTHLVLSNVFERFGRYKVNASPFIFDMNVDYQQEFYNKTGVKINESKEI